MVLNFYKKYWTYSWIIDTCLILLCWWTGLMFFRFTSTKNDDGDKILVCNGSVGGNVLILNNDCIIWQACVILLTLTWWLQQLPSAGEMEISGQRRNKLYNFRKILIDVLPNKNNPNLSFLIIITKINLVLFLWCDSVIIFKFWNAIM